MKKTKMFSIMLVSVLVLGMFSQLAFAGVGICEIIGSGSSKSAKAYILSSDNYMYLHVYFYKNGSIASVDHDYWGFYVSPHYAQTGNVSLSVGDEYYAYSAHGTGPIYSYCDDEWTYQTNTLTYGSKSISTNSGIDEEKSRLEAIGNEVSKQYNLITDRLEYYNLVDSHVNSKSNEFSKSLGVKVIGNFHKLLKVGDYAPSYWIDSENQTVFIGTKRKDGSYILYKSSWYIGREGNYIWTKLNQIK